MTDLTATERAIVVLVRLQSGAALTTREIAALTGLSCRGARKLLSRLARVVPIYCADGRWQLLN